LDGVIGVVLVGGRSSRMGKNKSMLDYKGEPLLEHIINIIKQTGITKIVISGELEGYDCIPDDKPFAGPAQAIMSVIRRISGKTGFLFVPVDMPLLTPETLCLLLQQKHGGYYKDKLLPAFIVPPYLKSEAESVQGLLDSFSINPIILPDDYLPAMVNINTPQEWKTIVSEK